MAVAWRRQTVPTPTSRRSFRSTPAISAYEAGERTPSPETVQQFAKVLRFPLEFFYGDDLDEFTNESASFRAWPKAFPTG